MNQVRDAFHQLIGRQDLSRAQTEELFGQLMDGELSDAMKAALLVALAMKGEAPSEIAGAAAAMRRRVVAIPHQVADVVDTCGTGGDGKGTFNISTTAALVASAAGVPIAKHGNRSVSSKSGSADVLAALGVRIDIDPETAGRALADIGIAFLFAPKLHPAMKEVMPIRHELGVRTIFNVLGPLTNPAGARRQVMGVYAASLVDVIGEVLRELGAEHAMVVHGSDGLDELTTTGPSRVAEVRGDGVRSYDLDPLDFGIPRAVAEDLGGGSPADNAEITRRILAGEAGPRTDVTVLNAAAAIYVGGRVEDLGAGIEVARDAIASGAARAKLAELAELA